MTDAALLAAIRAAPDDDAPRLVYADWLDEHGLPERAEFIRVQVELARRDSPDLRRREAELLAAHHDTFAGPLAAPHLRFRFHRGFAVGFGHTGVFAYVYPTFDPSASDRLRPPTTSAHLLRFHPDGMVEETISDLQPEGRIVSRFQRREYVDTSPYMLNSLLRPAGLQFSFSYLNGSEDYRGRLRGQSLVLDRYTRVSKSERRQRYVHIPITGFSSFPET